MQIWGLHGNNYNSIEGEMILVRYAQIEIYQQTLQLTSKGYIIKKPEKMNISLEMLNEIFKNSEKNRKHLKNLSIQQQIIWSSIPFISVYEAEKQQQQYSTQKIKPNLNLIRVSGLFVTITNPNKIPWYCGAKKYNFASSEQNNNDTFFCKKYNKIIENNEVEERWKLNITITDKNIESKIIVTILGELANGFMNITATKAHQMQKKGNWEEYLQSKIGKTWIFGLQIKYNEYFMQNSLQYIVQHLTLSKKENNENINKLEENEINNNSKDDGWL